MKVVELGSNFFQFIFDKKEETDRILQKRPWFFDNQMLVLHHWKPDLQREDPSCPMWVQIEAYLFIGARKRLAGNWDGSTESRMIRLLVELELDKPLLRGTKIKLGEEIIWVDLKYEHFLLFLL